MSDSFVANARSLFCIIRKGWVAASPEEIVRQRILLHMIDQKKFPASLVAVEQPLRRLSHLSSTGIKNIPNRRADIICFAKSSAGNSLHPLLVIECKSIKLAPSVINQVVGYNHFIGSRFIAIANHEEIRTGWYDAEKKDYVFINHLPSYQDLLGSLQH